MVYRILTCRMTTSENLYSLVGVISIWVHTNTSQL